MAAISPVYRTVFTIVDPVIAVWGAFLFFFRPDTVIDSFEPTEPRNPSHDFVLHQVGAHLLSCAGISAVVLRLRPADVELWSVVQACYLAVDVIFIGGTLKSYADQGRLNPQRWRPADWGSLAITGSLFALRAAFLMSVGARMGAAAPKKD